MLTKDELKRDESLASFKNFHKSHDDKEIFEA